MVDKQQLMYLISLDNEISRYIKTFKNKDDYVVYVCLTDFDKYYTFNDLLRTYLKGVAEMKRQFGGEK